ncbi:glycosyltransferase family A protein [Crocosphaera sp.]|uniref:glycosyltransferase family 2 protein n=1 Tax=Crocosphaera sp. TaxID=2729996 RepID=UPI00262D6571|nr:glycosyltransferase family A protein [Crocosphaera sp.]MDJ0583335.1 glycosyltransferase family A protein [Crocosphaera sp.]
MKWCVLITTYNRCQLLKRAINSAIKQTLPCEIVVIDDASTDETGNYLRSLGNNIKFHSNDRNLGHSASVNRGVQLADADWIKMLDDDDYLAANCLEIMDTMVLAYPQVVICSVKAIQMDENGRKCGKTPSVGSQKITHIPQSKIHYQMLIERLPFGTPVQVGFRKDAFLNAGGWDSQLDLHYDDIDSWLRIAQFGDALFINQYLAYRYVWPGGYNKQLPIKQRLAINWLIKQRLYSLIDDQCYTDLPSLCDLHNYLQLYWALIAFKQLELFTFYELIFPAILSIQAWRLLFNALFIPKSFKINLL